MKIKISILIFIIIPFSGCEKMFFEDDISNTPVNNFEIIPSLIEFKPTFNVKHSWV
jgi:hypothetical protein